VEQVDPGDEEVRNSKKEQKPVLRVLRIPCDHEYRGGDDDAGHLHKRMKEQIANGTREEDSQDEENEKPDHEIRGAFCRIAHHGLN
jgi:hypothetical protein